MLMTTMRKVVATEMPGTTGASSLTRTWRMVSIACTKVATNSPIACWLGRSCRKVCTIRGENCAIASWTTTIVMDSTVATRLTSEPATAPRMASAASGPPMTLIETASKPKWLSKDVVTRLMTIPATA